MRRGEDVLGSVPMLEDEEDEGVVDLLVINANGGSMLAPCSECGQGIIRARYCFRCDAQMNLFYGDAIEEEG